MIAAAQEIEWPVHRPPEATDERAAALDAVRGTVGLVGNCRTRGTRRALASADADAKPNSLGVYDDTERDDVSWGACCSCRAAADAEKKETGASAVTILSARLRATCMLDVVYSDQRRAQPIAGTLGELIRRGVHVVALQVVGPWEGIRGGIARGRRLVARLFRPRAGSAVHVSPTLVGTDRQAVVMILVPLALVTRHMEPDHSITIDEIDECPMPDPAAILAAPDPLWGIRSVERVDSIERLNEVVEGVVVSPLFAQRGGSSSDLLWLVDQLAPMRGRGKSVLWTGWLSERVLVALRRHLGLTTVVAHQNAQRLHRRAEGLLREAKQIVACGRAATHGLLSPAVEAELVRLEAAEAEAHAVELDDPTPAHRRAAKEATARRAAAGWSAEERPVSDGESYMFTDGLGIGVRTGVRRRPPRSIWLRPSQACDEHGVPLMHDEDPRWVPLLPSVLGPGATHQRWILPRASAAAAPAVEIVEPLIAPPNPVVQPLRPSTRAELDASGWLLVVPPLSVAEIDYLARDDEGRLRPDALVYASEEVRARMANSRTWLSTLHPDGVDPGHMIELSTFGHGRTWLHQVQPYVGLIAAEWIVRRTLAGHEVCASAGLRRTRGAHKEDTSSIRTIVI
jgi:hypothetical protein